MPCYPQNHHLLSLCLFHGVRHAVLRIRIKKPQQQQTDLLLLNRETDTHKQQNFLLCFSACDQQHRLFSTTSFEKYLQLCYQFLLQNVSCFKENFSVQATRARVLRSYDFLHSLAMHIFHIALTPDVSSITQQYFHSKQKYNINTRNKDNSNMSLTIMLTIKFY